MRWARRYAGSWVSCVKMVLPGAGAARGSLVSFGGGWEEVRMGELLCRRTLFVED